MTGEGGRAAEEVEDIFNALKAFYEIRKNRIWGNEYNLWKGNMDSKV